MEVSEHNLVFSDKRILRLDGLFHLHDQVGLPVNLGNVGQYFSPHGLVVAVLKAAVLARLVLHEDLMSVP